MNVIAGLSAFFAIPAVALAMLYWGQFLVSRSQQDGRRNDIAAAVVMIFLILPVIAVNDLVGGSGWFNVVSWAAVAGLVLMIAGQALLVAGAIRLETSFMTGGVGFVPFIAWAVTLTVRAFQEGPPPEYLAWSAVALFVLIVPVVLFAAAKPRIAIPVQWLMCVGLKVWLAFLGWFLVEA